VSAAAVSDADVGAHSARAGVCLGAVLAESDARPTPSDTKAELEEQLDLIKQRSRHLADAASAACKYASARLRSARILWILLDIAPNPRSRQPLKESFYIYGAVVRKSASPAGIQLWWRNKYFPGVEPPTQECIEEHLKRLQKAGALIRLPGDLRGFGEGLRPQYNDSIHLIYTEREETWWDQVGMARWKKAGLSRDPRLCRRLFKRWRDEAADPQLRLRFDELKPDHPDRTPVEKDAELDEMAQKLEHAAFTISGNTVIDGWSLLSACYQAGIKIERNDPQEALAKQPETLRKAMRALARHFRRRCRIWNPAGWLIRACGTVRLPGWLTSA
jgi:hypothetical protein